mgnify:CR=1 FL=1
MNLLREYIRTLLIEVAIGQCYPHAVKMARGATDEEFNDLTRFKVVHGRITDKFSGESVLHAWVEKGDMIFDWQTHSTKPDGIDRETYYDIFQPEVHSEYTAEEAMTNCLRSGGKAGPWTLREGLAGDETKVYRAMPLSAGSVRTGDYVTMSRKFAQTHATSSAVFRGEPFQVIMVRVPSELVLAADNPGEYIYNGPAVSKLLRLDIATEEGEIVSPRRYGS